MVPMHARTRELLEFLDSQHALLREAFDAMPEALRRTRPASDQWSAVDVVEHLARVNMRVSHGLGAKLEAARTQGSLVAASASTSILHAMPIARLVDRTQKFVTGEGARPRGEVDAATAWGDADRTFHAVRDLVVRYDGLALDVVTVPHPAFGDLDGYQTLIFVGAHDARHAAQIREIHTALGGPAA
jgi:hypothetical protein